MFRLSATLTEKVDLQALEAAQENVLKRLPTFACRLRKGAFWYYFEKIGGAPKPQEDVGNPMVRMDLRENDHFLYRIRWYKNRVAVEFFHALTDGTGGLSFLLTLIAEYLRIRYGANIPAQGLILNCADAPKAEEAEDSFGKYARGAGSSRREPPAYHISGRPERRHFLNITTGILPKDAVKAKAKARGVSVTAFLTAVLIDCYQQKQFEDTRAFVRGRPVKVSVPINLRPFYGSKTVRNFASYINVGVHSAYGRYTFEEILNAVKHTMGLEITEKVLNSRLTTNVKAEKNPFVRVMPLFVKVPFMRAAFRLQGERYSSTTFSNLGEVRLPESMRPYVTRMDFILGVPAQNPVVCSCLTYGENMVMSFSRKTREPLMEEAFFTSLVKMGIPVKIESNRR